MKKIIILASGSGTNTKNIIEYFKNIPSIEISMVISNKRNAGVFEKVEKYKIPTLYINKESYKKNHLLVLLENIKPDLIILAGFLLKIPISIINSFKKKIINIHPSLLPKFKGLNTFEKVLKNNERKTGCTVHYVDEKIDNGKIILQKSFFINKDDNIKILKNKTQRLEYLAFSEAIIKIYRYS